MSEVQIPVDHMFTMVLEGLNDARHDYVGPFGRRIFEKASGGTIRGARLNGQVLRLHATDYGRASLDGSLRQLDAEAGLLLDDGTAILMRYRGRMSPRYGAGQSRISAVFDVADGPHGWINGIQAMGVGEERADGTTVIEVYQLTGEAESEGPRDTATDPSQRRSLPAEFVLRRKSEHEPGSKRHTVASPFGARYFTLAEAGGAFKGPKIAGQFLSGYSWSPHYMHAKGEPGQPGFEMLMHYDVKTLLRTDDGTSVLMAYTGATSGAYARGAWMTATLFEVPEGPHAWLNEVQAVGAGRWAGDGAEYRVFALL
ncbi:DUF3237 family protein [Sphingomonas crocodyli]|uniref:DUF3237 family protein n=1 Tax=Sphingomonas crocodyli TaxID=1979270 RepID=A0A437M9J3_9SPHN|nr:DUF3237 family protein [Sphingomonas crocodyli]RVT94303.1 DUF3237 family protein [Sphingomonas crocodyli]